MKRVQPVLFGVLLLILVTSTQSWAEEGSLSVGLKSWFSVWDTGEAVFPDSDTTLSWGPTVVYRKGKQIFGVSFVKGEYDFKGTVGTTPFSLAAERSETDLFTGLQVTPSLTLVVGLKHLLAELEAGPPLDVDEEIDEWLTVFAASAHHVFNMQAVPVTIFGTLALVDGSLSGELGGAVPVAKTSFSFFGGYKRQEFGDETLEGAFFGITYFLS